ncbi:hypothetical protein D9Q98_008465 [Chlorella vulgaris]|uniref:Peptidase S8/S53 domain-containing protein n=1 Tax=Chlorella vulgaris TaxID=3077 RepID=A0A9D4TGS2_CHLVU|nr:hypothetical protein D9Q98_008465 [Chlorella vulgaris]
MPLGWAKHLRRRQRRRQLPHLVLALCLCAALLSRPVAAQAQQQDSTDYVVVFKRGFDASKVAALCAEQRQGQRSSGAAAAFRGLCRKRFSALLNGFAGTLTQADVGALHEAFPGSIDHIEQDSHFTITGEPQPEWLHSDEVPQAALQGRRRQLLADARRARRRVVSAAPRRRLPEEEEQQGPTWNLDRIDQRNLPLDQLYRYDATGSGINVYLLDTGIRFTHQEFGSQPGQPPVVRARHGYSVFGDNNSSDCNGHGTHTAATVGGLTYGVAKNVTLWAVRAMDCAGGAKVSAILDAFEWIASNAIQPAVVSMSVAGDLSPAVNEAARRLVEDRLIPLVVAAGNSQENACLMSPASSPWVVSVAAADDQDRRWTKSNWGPCVDVHGPGVAVLSAGSMSDTATQYKTGTSMATPHVTGVLALYLQTHPGASPQELRQKVNGAATPNAVHDDPDGYGSWSPATRPNAVDLSTTPNRLLYSFLPAQAILTPSVLTVDSSTAGPMAVSVVLTAAPSADVVISVTVPTAAWSGSALATVSQSTLTFLADAWDVPQVLSLEPSSSMVDGTYYITLTFLSADPRFDSAMHSIKVVDQRPLTGDSLAQPRLISQLPYTDSDTSSRFSSKFLFSTSTPTLGSASSAPEVVYAFTAPADMAVDISTCGSLFDTQLYLTDDPQDPQAYEGNDDDPSCTSNPKASRLSTTFQSGITYFIVVDGFSGDWLSSQGLYTLTLTPSTATA